MVCSRILSTVPFPHKFPPGRVHRIGKRREYASGCVFQQFQARLQVQRPGRVQSFDGGRRSFDWTHPATSVDACIEFSARVQQE